MTSLLDIDRGSMITSVDDFGTIATVTGAGNTATIGGSTMVAGVGVGVGMSINVGMTIGVVESMDAGESLNRGVSINAVVSINEGATTGSTDSGGATMGVYVRTGGKLVKLAGCDLRDMGDIGDVRDIAPNSMSEGDGGMVRGHCLTANCMSSSCCCTSKLADAGFWGRGSCTVLPHLAFTHSSLQNTEKGKKSTMEIQG